MADGVANRGAGKQPAGRRKRLDGEGSISPHATGGYRARLMVGYRPDGKPDVRQVYGRTQDECREKLEALRRRHRAGELGTPEAERETVAGFLRAWLETKQRAVKPRTYERYAELVALHLAPALGKTRLVALRPDQLDRLYGAKEAAGLSKQTVLHLHRVLHTALAQAVKWGYLARNVAEQATPPRVDGEGSWEATAPDGLEVVALLDAAEASGDRLRALWQLAVSSGLRLGELTGLVWDDVTIDDPAGRHALRVRRTLQEVRAGAPVWGRPKSRQSRRALHIGEDAAAALRAHRLRQQAERLARGLGKAPADRALVFATRRGTPLDRGVVQAQFKNALSRAGLPPDRVAAIRFHDLRHFAATAMIDGGETIPTVTRILGHSKQSTTLNFYSHALEERVRLATGAIERRLRAQREASGRAR